MQASICYTVPVRVNDKTYFVKAKEKMDEKDKKKATAIIEEAFGKKIIRELDSNLKLFVIENSEDNEWKGLVLAKIIHNENKEKLWYIDKLAVKPEYKKNGIATALIEFAYSVFKNYILRAHYQNVIALEFYNKMLENKRFNLKIDLSNESGWIIFANLSEKKIENFSLIIKEICSIPKSFV